jgi:hypothetical protein
MNLDVEQPAVLFLPHFWRALDGLWQELALVDDPQAARPLRD